ncbi:MAG: LytR family transcriptional regulator, partial [Anaerolineae bacterium]|nr:LytR family transcriptional regulator [Anaerolineae bacterium]
KIMLWTFLLFGLIGGIQRNRLNQQPLGPRLDLPTPTPSIQSTLKMFPIGTGTNNVTSTPSEIPQTATSTPQPACGGPAAMNILVVGSDARGDHYLYGLADAIRLVRVDFVNKRLAILEVPRDLWVDIPGISDHYNITQGKMNQAYLYGNKGLGYYHGPGEGPGLLARTLDLNLGAHPDHYLAVNMITFRNIVDAVGGIDVYLPYGISVRSKENPKGFAIPPGQHHIDGETALWIARIRQYNVFTRAENQNIVMCALRKKILSPAIVPAVPELITTFQRYVQTDFSPEQINQLACLASQIHGGDVVFASFPIELFKSVKQYDPQLKATTSILDADKNILRDYIDRFQQGVWPDPNLFIDTTPSPGNVDAEFACED